MKFITYATAEVMVDNISYADAEVLCDTLEDIEGVKSITLMIQPSIMWMGRRSFPLPLTERTTIRFVRNPYIKSKRKCRTMMRIFLRSWATPKAETIAKGNQCCYGADLRHYSGGAAVYLSYLYGSTRYDYDLWRSGDSE